MIKRVSIEQRNKLRKEKENINKLIKMLKVLIAKGVITKEDLK